MRYLVFCILAISICSPMSAFAQLSLREIQVSSTATNDKIAGREKTIIQIISAPVFLSLSREPLSVILDSALVEPRGRFKGRTITLSTAVIREGEFVKLFIHEFAHFIDIYILTSTSGVDPSDEFYNISWEDAYTKHAGQKQRNFVSGYAATNQYEDFAESIVFYVFHNQTFQDRAIRDDVMRQKYLFLQGKVFTTGEFSSTEFATSRVPSYLWDTTKVPISLQKYLYSLN